MTPDVRPAAVAGRFYPADKDELSGLVRTLLAPVTRAPFAATAAVVPHAGLIYSGACAARVYARLRFPPVVVVLAPNHTGRVAHGRGAGLWSCGAFATSLGPIRVAAEFCAALEAETDLVAHDATAHATEHAIEVQLPFLAILAPESRIVPIVLAFDDWPRCRALGHAVADVAARWPTPVLLLASSDMTHYEPAPVAKDKDRHALDAIAALDGEGLLAACARHNITMCGRAPTAAVLAAAARLGASGAEVVDYRHSGMVTGDDASVVSYAGAVIS